MTVVGAAKLIAAGAAKLTGVGAAERVAELRAAAAWTLEGAAAKIGIGSRRLQDIEAGSINLTLRTLVRLANTFGVRVADLFVVVPVRLPRR